MAEEIMIHQTRICNINRERKMTLSKEVGFEVEMPISLVDVFSAVDTHQYPLLWREFIKENTVVPSSLLRTIVQRYQTDDAHQYEPRYIHQEHNKQASRKGNSEIILKLVSFPFSG